MPQPDDPNGARTADEILASSFTGKKVPDRYAAEPVDLRAVPREHWPALHCFPFVLPPDIAAYVAGMDGPEIIARSGDVLAGGQSVEEACKKLEVSPPTCHRWRQEYGGAKEETIKRLKALEKENGQLKKLVADLSLPRTPGQQGRGACPQRCAATPPPPCGSVELRLCL